jgi:hypothetical protein
LRMLPLSQVSCMVDTELVEYANRKPKARSCETRSVILNLVEINGLNSSSCDRLTGCTLNLDFCL